MRQTFSVTDDKWYVRQTFSVTDDIGINEHKVAMLSVKKDVFYLILFFLNYC